MPSSEKHHATVNLVSKVFEETGYQIQVGRPFGSHARRQYADIVALGPQDAFIVEVKTTRTGSSDVMAMKSFLRIAQSEPMLEGKEVKGIIVSPGTLDPAKVLSREWGIEVIEGETAPKIEKGLHQLLRAHL